MRWLGVLEDVEKQRMVVHERNKGIYGRRRAENGYMKGLRFLILVVAVSLPAAGALCQEGRRSIERVRDHGARGRTWEYEVLRDGMSRPTPVNTPLPGVGIRDRLVLIQDEIGKLQAKKSQAVKEGTAAEKVAAIDARIEELRRLAAVLKSEQVKGLE